MSSYELELIAQYYEKEVSELTHAEIGSVEFQPAELPGDMPTIRLKGVNL